VNAFIQSYPVQPPAIGKILITQGQGLDNNDSLGVVLDQPFAIGHHIQIGDTITLPTAQRQQFLHVRGLSFDVNHDNLLDGYIPRIFMLRETLVRFSSAQMPLSGRIGIRLFNPDEANATLKDISTQFTKNNWKYSFSSPASQDVWLDYKQHFGLFSRTTAIIAFMFGLIGLIAAAAIITTLIAGQVLAQQRDLGILKAIGFTSRQLIMIISGQYLILGIVGSLIGIISALLAAPPLMSFVSTTQGIMIPITIEFLPLAILFASCLFVILLSALIPSRRAGKIRVVEVLRPSLAGNKQGQRILARMLSSGWSPIVVVGLIPLLSRPVRSLMLLLTLFIGVIATIYGIGINRSIDSLFSDKAMQGITADARVTADLYDPLATQKLVANQSEIERYYTELLTNNQIVKGGEGILPVSFVANDTRTLVQSVSDGRWYNNGADELVVAPHTLSRLHAHIGDTIILSLQQGDNTPLHISYKIVGVLSLVFPSDMVFAPLSSYTSHLQLQENDILGKIRYNLTLRSGYAASDLVHQLLKETDARIGAEAINGGIPAAARPMVFIGIFMGAILLVVAGISTMNAMILSTRERYREFGILKAIGFTPRAILTSLLLSSVWLAIIALAIGIPPGIWLATDGIAKLAENTNGVMNLPKDMNTIGIVPLIIATLLVAIGGAFIPARRAMQVPVAEVIRHE
jgi:putative ABC transport system permease protein